MTQRVEFFAEPASHGMASGYLAEPEGRSQVPGIVLLQEFWGLNNHIKSLAERWAAAGFLTVAPDLYRGAITSDRAEASKLMAGLDRERALADIAGAAKWLGGQARCTGKVGVTGFCMGGAYAFVAAVRVPGLSAVAPFYGVPPSMDWSQVTAPIQAHFAARDTWATPEAAQQIQRALQQRGATMDLFVYDAEHAFCNDTRPAVFAPEHAALAWQRTVDFMRQHLG
jgi:carboxymethylenebutenolidase